MRTRRLTGASALEILFIVAILAVLAVIAYPRVRGMMAPRAAQSPLARDLEQVVAAEEAHFGQAKAYAGDSTVLRAARLAPGTIVSFGPATADGWSASATNPARSAETCSVFYGTAAPRPPATVKGEIACK